MFGADDQQQQSMRLHRGLYFLNRGIKRLTESYYAMDVMSGRIAEALETLVKSWKDLEIKD